MYVHTYACMYIVPESLFLLSARYFSHALMISRSTRT